MIILANVKKYALKLAGVALGAALVWGNFQYINAKNERITALGEKVFVLDAEKALLEKALDNKLKSEVVTEKVVEAVKKEETKQEKAKSQAAVYVNTKLAEIEKKYATKEPSPTNEQRKNVEISLERAKGLWLTYCLQEPEEEPCKYGAVK